MELNELFTKAFSEIEKGDLCLTASGFRALLVDICGDDFEGRKAANLFSAIDNKVGLFDMISNGKAEAEILARYSEAADIIPEDEYRFVVEAILRAEGGGSALSAAYPKGPTTVVQVKKKGSQKRGRKKGGKGTSPVKKSSPAPLPVQQPLPLSPIRAYRGAIIQGVVALLAGILFAVIFTAIGGSWQWQHGFGAVGGMAYFLALLFTAKHFAGEDGIIVMTLAVFLFITVNAISSCLYPERYRIVALWGIGYALLFSSFLAFCGFSRQKAGWGVFAIGEGLLAVLMLFAVGLFEETSWTVWQLVIGGCGGVLLFFLLWLGASLLSGEGFSGAYRPHIYAIIPVMILTGVLRGVVGDSVYFITIIISSLTFLSSLTAFGLSVKVFDEDASIVPAIEMILSAGAVPVFACI